MSGVMLYDTEGLLQTHERDTIECAANETFRYEGKRASVTIFTVDKPAIREANHKYRGIDDVTDVLSFPVSPPFAAPTDGYYGDILICVPRAHEQADEYGHSHIRELAFLTIHGTLHLIGYDHETYDEEETMCSLQSIILERMELLT